MLITATTHSTYSGKFSDGAFLVALGENSVGIYISKQSDIKNEIEMILKMTHGFESYEFKVVGHSDVVLSVEKELATKKIKLKKKILLTTAFEIIFLPTEKKLKLKSVAAENYNLNHGSSELINKEKINVLIVDDSQTVRKILRKVLSEDPQLNVIAEAEDPSQVEDLIVKHCPHVMTLDIHMPGMDGVTLLKKIFPKYKIPTIMISSISLEEGSIVLNALEEGAVDYIKKPTFEELRALAPVIVEKVKSAAQAKVSSKERKATLSKFNKVEMDSRKIIAVGSSTGGTEALKDILVRLPSTIPPIVVVQHIPPVFSKAFADRLNRICEFEVLEAKDGDELLPSRVLIAPGGCQMKLVKSKNKFFVRVNDDAPVNRHKPSVDYLFDSVAELVGRDALGVILTGMGADGARGLLKMKNSGAWTVAQSKETCVVYGMPKEAINRGAAVEVLDLDDIAERLVAQYQRKRAA